MSGVFILWSPNNQWEGRTCDTDQSEARWPFLRAAPDISGIRDSCWVRIQHLRGVRDHYQTSWRLPGQDSGWPFRVVMSLMSGCGAGGPVCGHQLTNEHPPPASLIQSQHSCLLSLLQKSYPSLTVTRCLDCRSILSWDWGVSEDQGSEVDITTAGMWTVSLWSVSQKLLQCQNIYAHCKL